MLKNLYYLFKKFTTTILAVITIHKLRNLNIANKYCIAAFFVSE